MQLLKFRVQVFILFLLGVSSIYAQIVTPTNNFNTPRWNNGGASVKGDFLAIGNNFVTANGFANRAYNGTTNNNSLVMVRVDADNDGEFYSAATLNIPSVDPNCRQIKWAGMYWASYYPMSRYPGTGHTELWWETPDGNKNVVVADQTIARDANYYYHFKDVTQELRALSNPNGEYKVSGRFSHVFNNATQNAGTSGGWALFVVYEDPDPSVVARKITIYDGYQGVGAIRSRDINVTGFQTIPTGPVKARIGVLALEGDRGGNGDRFQLRNSLGAFEDLGRSSGAPNARDNFFDSSISVDGSYVTTRRPASQNTLGWDLDVFNLENPNNRLLANNATSTTMRLVTTGDYYTLMATAFSVEVIAPKLEIEKKLSGFDASGNEIDFRNKTAKIGDELIYEMRFRNVGNDDAVRGQFEDVFPFNAQLLNVESVATGTTIRAGYPKDTIVNGVTRKKVIYNIDDALLKQKGTWSSAFRFRIKVVGDCGTLRDVCSNFIENQAYIKYKSALDVSLGVNQFITEGSYDGLGSCAKDPSPTNFYIDVSTCNTPMDVFLCGTTTTLTAGAGYDTYQWRKQGSTAVVGTGRTLNVTSEGTYVVTKTLANNTCQNTLTETFVVRYDSNQAVNPLLDFVAQRNIEICGNDGKAYVQIPLCGDGASQTFNLTPKYPSGTPIHWYKFNGVRPTSLPAACPQPMTAANTAQWQLLHTGGQYSVDTEGEYAVQVTFTSGSDTCSQLYYFRVTKSNYTYTATGTDIFTTGTTICRQGEIHLSGITGNNQQYQILRGTSTIVGWTNVPTGGSVTHTGITQAGEYRVQVREKVSAPLVQENVCAYEKKVTIRSFNLSDEFFVDTQDVLCSATSKSTGKIRVRVSGNVSIPYSIQVRNTTTNTQITTYSSIADSDANATQLATLSSLQAGNYSVTLTYGTTCSTSKQVVINELPPLLITNISADAITCSSANTRTINVVVAGGTPANSSNKYQFYVYTGTGFATQIARANVTATELSATASQVSYKIDVEDAWAATLTEKDYRVEVIDANNCVVTGDVKVTKAEKPKFTATTDPADCNLTAGRITATLNNSALASQYNISYSIRKKNASGTWGSWVAYQSSNVFSGLTTGDYQVRVRYSIGSVVCYYPEDIQLVTDPATGNQVTPNPIPEDQRPIEVTIGDGGGPVRGFVGITKLACTTGAVTGATIRVANVSGGEYVSGSVKYQYKLDGGAWLNDVNTFTNVAPGTHTIRVRGKNTNCEFTQTITIDPPLTLPNITQNVTYDCEGKGHISLTPDNANYDYSYDQTGTATNWQTTTSAYTFPTGYSAGTETLRVYYRAKTSPNPNILLKEDFGQGSPVSVAQLGRNASITPNFTFKNPLLTSGATAGCVGWNEYTIISYEDFHDAWWASNAPCPGHTNSVFWIADAPVDHTGLTNGRYMYVDMGTNLGAGEVLYAQTVNDVIPNQPIKFEVFIMNLNKPTATQLYPQSVRPNIQIVVKNAAGVELGRVTSGDISYNNVGNTNWVRVSSDAIGTINPGNNTSVTIEIRNTKNSVYGNDFAIDDIYVYQEPESCLDYVDIPVLVQADKNFDLKPTTEVKQDVTCHGGNNGSYKIEVANFNATTGFRYRLLRGTTPHTPTSGYATTTNGTLSFTGLTAGNYRLEVQFDATNTACHKTRDFVITQPAELVVTLSSTATNLFLNCQETQRQIRLSDLVSVQGGSTPYTYTLTNTTTGTPVTIDSQGFVLLSAGTHTLRVVDTRNCNTPTSTKVVTFNVQQRQAPTLVLTRDNCATASGTNVRANVTRSATSASATLTYQIKLSSDPNFTTMANNSTSTTYTFNNLPAGTYDIRVIDQYNCSVTEQIRVFTPFSATASATTKHKCGTTETPGVVSVTPTGGSGSYTYAYMATNTTPAASDYVASPTKSYPYSTTDEVVYVYVKDTSTDCVVSVGRVDVKGTPATDFTFTTTNPDCVGENTGVLRVTLSQGAPTFSVEVLQGTTQLAEYTNVNTIPTTFSVTSLEAGTYTISVTDVNGCVVTKTATITDPELNGTIQDVNRTPTACNPAQADLGFRINLTPTSVTAGYVTLYSKDNGATWQTSNEFTNIAGGTSVQPVIGRFPTGTTVNVATGRASNSILCRTDLGVYVTKILGGVEVDYAAMPTLSAGCVASYSVPVRIGSGTFYDVAYALDSQTATSWIPVAGSPATRYTYTFANLIPGRQYTIYARYKLNATDPDYCYSSTSIDLTDVKVPQPNIKITPTPVPICTAGATTGTIEFALSGGTATTISYELWQIDTTTGVESAVAGTLTSPYSYNPSVGATIRVNSVPLSSTILYYLRVDESIGGTLCVSASNSTRLEYIVANPITFASPASITLDCTATGRTTAVNATGGSGSGFTYKILREDITSTQVLRREIRTTTSNLTLYRSEFTSAFLSTNPTSVTLRVVAIDRLTYCEEEVNWVVNFTPAPTFSVAVNNNCTLPYSITITPTTGAVTDYLYSIDEGKNYSASPTLQVPVNFSEGKIRVMHRNNGCVGALTTNNIIVFPAFTASARVSAMPTSCTGPATITIDVESGSSAYRYDIYNSAGVSVASSTFTGVFANNGKINAPLPVNVPSGDTYRVEITDTNRSATASCAKVTINNLSIEAPQTPVLVLEQVPATCNGANDGQIIAKLAKATHTQGDYTYVLSPMTAGIVQHSYETATDIGARFTGLASGVTYTITAISKYNCQAQQTATLTAPPILIGSVVVADTDTEFRCSNPLGESKARLTLTASGGTAPYRFSIDGVNWVEVPLVAPATSAQHTFEIADTGALQTITYHITDVNNCSPITATHTLNTRKQIASSINLSLNSLMTCLAGELVNIEFSSNQQSINGYDVVVRSAPVGAPAIATHTIAGTAFTIGSSGEYVYTSTMALPQQAGTYVLTITDNDTGCDYTSVSYEVKEVVTPSVTATAAMACSTTATTAQVNIELTFVGDVSGGYSYDVYRGTSTTAIAGASGSSSSNTESIQFTENVSVSDTYRVVITMTANACVLETSVDVQQADHPLTATGNIIKQISYNCNTGTHNGDGIIELTSVTGGWGPEYLYALYYGSTGLRTAWSTQMRYESLAPDTYEIWVQDVNGCESTTGPIVLVQPTQLNVPLAVPTTSTPVSCFGGNDGSVRLTGVVGGSGVYSYTLFNGEGQAIRTSKDNVPVTPPTSPVTYVQGEVLFENLTAGNYKIRITDELFECNIPLEFTAVVTGPDIIRATAAIVAYPDCNVNGDIQITTAGGTSPYTYQRVNPTTNAPIGAPNTTGTFTGVIDYNATATYKFLITDTNGCTEYTNEVTIDAVQDLAIQVDSTEDKLKCSGDAAGVIRVSATGGSVDQNFLFELLDATGTPFTPAVTNATGIFEYLVAGTYRVRVTKGTSCAPATTGDILIEANPVYTGQAVQTNVTCFGAKNGTYTIITNITGQTLFDGSARRLEYAISPRLDRFARFDGNVLQITDLEPGVYTIIIQDQNGCRPDVLDATGTPIGTDVFTFTITEPPVFNVAVTPNSTIHEGCLGASDGEFKLTLSGGKPFTDATGTYYEYSTDNTFATGVQKYYVTGATVADQKIAGLPAGTNTIWVRDENGCAPREVEVVINAGVDLQATHTLIYTCNGTNTMSNRVTVNVNPAEIGNVMYYLNSRTATPTNNPVFVFPAVPVGGTPQTYTIYVVSNKRNHHECEQILSVTIDPIAALTWGTPNVTHILCHGESSGKIVANVTGGSGNYEYSISPNTTTFVTTNTFENLSAGYYHVTVRDIDYNCSVTETIQIIEPTQLNVRNLTERALVCPGKKEGAITFTPEGGTIHPAGNKYSYSVTSLTDATIVVPQTDISEDAMTGEVTIINMAAGRYTLRVTDENGCYIERIFEIEDAPSLVLSKVELVYTCGVTTPYGKAPTTSQNSTYAVWVTFPTQDIDKTLMRYTLKDGTGTPLNGGALQTFTRFDSNDTAVIEGLTLPDDDYVMTLYYGTCPQELALPTQVIKVRNYNAMTISDVSVTTENNLIRVSVTGGKDKDVNGNQLPYKVYFNYPKYTQIRDLTTNYNQYTEFKPDASNLNATYYLQKGDETEWGLDGKEYKKVRVYVEDEQGCGYYFDILKEFVDIEIPNYFTPNGDGINDLWYPENIQNYPNAVIEIFDRYGRFIAKLKPGEGWNGYYNGKELPSGDYWYIIHVNAADDDRVFKGHFTLYR